MHKTKLLSSAFASVVLISTLATECGKIAQAQRPMRPIRPISLLRAKCVDSGVGNVREQDLDVSMGKAVYSSQFYLGPGYRSASITCNIKPDKNPQAAFQTLNLGFGMRDNDTTSPSVEVRVYLDGRQAETRTVSPTQQTSLSLDVSNAGNVAIEAVCTSQTQYCDRVYFYNAALQRQSPPPATKK
ncbi:MAG: hypothetical protein DSM106950_24160 [Stigonema ocellatum SAG 48.90 = DSM 106950]|nr:hypothetical protein [Stigonema ocellatum SAG 48.90 = DSM 106950]